MATHEFVFRDLTADLAARLGAYTHEESRLRAEAAALAARHAALKPPYWVDVVARPLAARVLAALPPDRELEVLGPHGIGSRVHLHFHRKGVPPEDRFKEDNCLGLALEPGDLSRGEVRLVDYSVDTGRYPPGTLGEVNDLNHPAGCRSPTTPASHGSSPGSGDDRAIELKREWMSVRGRAGWN
jgi:hypothetical protein